MVKGFLLLKLRSSPASKLRKAFEEFDKIKSLSIVTGETDAIAQVEVKDVKELFSLVKSLRKKDVVLESKTSIVIQELL